MFIVLVIIQPSICQLSLLRFYFALLVNTMFIISLYFFSSAGAGFVLSSSTILYFDSCLYARNTISAIIRKSIIFDIKSPYLNSVVEPVMFVTFADILSRLLAGRNNPINGSII